LEYRPQIYLKAIRKYFEIYVHIYRVIKISAHLMITIQKAGAQRPFDHSVYVNVYISKKYLSI